MTMTFKLLPVAVRLAISEVLVDQDERTEWGRRWYFAEAEEQAEMETGLIERTALDSPARTKPRSDRRQRRDMIFARLLPEERAKVESAANAAGVTMSEFVRSAALRAASR